MKILFDTETTGLVGPSTLKLSQQPYITEIFCCKIDDNYELIEEFGSLVKPPIPIPELITKITGITDDTLKDAPSFSDIYPDLVKFFFGVDEIIAHNLTFDRDMLKHELMRMDKLLQFPWPPKHTCAVEKSYHIEGHRLSLAKLHTKVCGAPHTGGHRAKEDVYALVRCYHWLCENGHIV